QMMQDKAEYAKKGISKGRSTVAMEYKNGILLLADNPSSLNKISEIYDKIAFAGAGKYSEFENLRKAGIRHADMKGYLYSREDVTAKSLANAYSQSLGTIFSQEIKPLEVEILVIEVGETVERNEIYRISFDGSIYDEKGFTAIGGKAEALMDALRSRYRLASLKEALHLCVETMEEGYGQKVTPEGMEVAVLDRTRTGRTFQRLHENDLKAYFKGSG
ncbi:MAG: proteasome subunit alpha, partial [Nitrospiria bacterium]